MSDEKSFSVCQETLPLFRAVLKFCSTNRLFTNFKHLYFLFINNHRNVSFLFYSFFCFPFPRYNPTYLWGKNGHFQTMIHAALGRFDRKAPPIGKFLTLYAADGATITYMLYDSRMNNTSEVVCICLQSNQFLSCKSFLSSM